MAKVNGKYLNDIAGDLPVDLQLEYAKVKESYLAHKATQKAFEDMLREHLDCPDLVCSYRFGQLSVSIGEPKPAKVSKPKINLAQWLEQQQ
jgi:hypothetical protein